MCVLCGGDARDTETVRADGFNVLDSLATTFEKCPAHYVDAPDAGLKVTGVKDPAVRGVELKW